MRLAGSPCRPACAGSGAALAGSSLPIDRESVRTKLGFESIARNSLDVSSDRDFLLEFVFDLTTIAIHLSGWAEEWVIWSTTEFNFLDLPDGFCTGSSIMPHKKNPDVLELTRGKAGRVIGCLNQLLILVKGLPLAYNRDLQEDKAAVFDAFDTVAGCLAVAAPMVRQTKLRREVIASRIEDGFLDATTLMEALIAHGVPMRSAHEAVGKLVVLAPDVRVRHLADLPRGARGVEEERLEIAVLHAVLPAHLLHHQLGVGSDLQLVHARGRGAAKPRDQGGVLGDVVRRDPDRLAARLEDGAVVRLEHVRVGRRARVPARAAVRPERRPHSSTRW